MARTLDAAFDHVAIAVLDLDLAETRWRDALGGARLTSNVESDFAVRQLRYPGGGKLELIAPAPADPRPTNFVRRFVNRYGTRIHHVTLTVPDLAEAIGVVTTAGLEVVDVQDAGDTWQEAFLRPSQVGGIVIQLAWSGLTDDEWAAGLGVSPEPLASEGPSLLGPILRHPDLHQAGALWALLGAEVTELRGRLRCTWTRSPMELIVVQGDAGPGGVRFNGAVSMPATDGIGPAVVI